MMTNSVSLISDGSTSEYSPILELIPSFKLIKHKSFLSEFAVGAGRLMICGLRLEADDPAAKWLRAVILQYLAEGRYVSAPAWDADRLLNSISGGQEAVSTGKKIDEGGRPVDD